MGMHWFATIAAAQQQLLGISMGHLAECVVMAAVQLPSSRPHPTFQAAF